MSVNEKDLYWTVVCIPLEYWLLKESQYPSISKLTQNLVSAPSSEAYVESFFGVG